MVRKEHRELLKMDEFIRYVEKLEKERNELASQVERLQYLFNDLFSCHLNSDYREVERKIRSVL